MGASETSRDRGGGGTRAARWRVAWGAVMRTARSGGPAIGGASSAQTMARGSDDELPADDARPARRLAGREPSRRGTSVALPTESSRQSVAAKQGSGMRNADVRRACLALMHHHLQAVPGPAEPAAVALGWHLENGGTSANAMAALCGGALAGRAAASARWQPSDALRTLLEEYGVVRRDGASVAGSHPATPARGPAADALH